MGTDAEADIDATVHPIRDLVCELDLRLHLRVLLAELLQHRREHRRERRLRGSDAKRPGDRVTRLPHMRKRPLQSSQRGKGLFE
jgi:hypothetical protein